MKVFWFDTETSGTDPHNNGIIQLAYLLEVDGRIEEKGTLYSNCKGKEITDRALEINGYSREQIDSFPDPSVMYKKLHALLNKYVNAYDSADKVIAGGYNVEFDVRFLRRLWFDNGDKYFGSFFAFGAVDPAVVFRLLQREGVFDPIIKLTLSDLAEYLGVYNAGAHDAMADILMTRAALEVMKDVMKVAVVGEML